MFRSNHIVVVVAAAAFTLGPWVIPAHAVSFSTQYTDGGTWESVFAQGFKASVTPTPDPAHAAADVVHLDRFQFFKSGATTYNSGNDAQGNPVLVPIPPATNVQLAIVSNLFFNLTNFTTNTTTTPQFVGLSTNTIADMSTIATGAPIVFDFNDLPITYGANNPDNQGVNTYGAVFVNNNGGVLTPVRVPTIVVNYLTGQNEIQSDYGMPFEYQLSAVGFMHTDQYGTWFDAYNETATGRHGDANFIATFDIPKVLGDYNNNGIVDAADYTVWRDHLGQTFTLPNRDSGNSGPINQNDYTFWKTRFGMTSGAGHCRPVQCPSPRRWH